MIWKVKIKHDTYHEKELFVVVRRWPWQTVEVGRIVASFAASNPDRLTALIDSAQALADDLNNRRRRRLIPRKTPPDAL